MSGASMNEIKARMRSVKSTMQITRAMELVATSKLRRVREGAEGAQAYYDALERAVKPLLRGLSLEENGEWLSEGQGDEVLYIVVAGDRGLAGGYNSNIFKLARSSAAGESATYLAIGKKAFDSLSHNGGNLLCGQRVAVSELDGGDCYRLAQYICEQFAAGRFRRVELIYTQFVSILTQAPQRSVLLPLELGGQDSDGQDAPWGVVTDTPPERLAESVIPELVCGKLYLAVRQSVAAETAARRTAMNSANKNAEEMINGLTLNYNRARQAVITQEITEIVSGADAL